MVSVSDLSTSSLYSLLREKYTAGVEDWNVYDAFIDNRLSTAPETATGRQLTGAVGVKRSAALRGQPQVGATYPAPGARSVTNWSVQMAVKTGTVATEEVAMHMTTDDGAFAQAATEDYMSFMQHYADEKEREALGNGSGCINIHGGIARVPGGGALAPTVAGWQFAVSIYDARKLRAGMMINFWRVTTALNSTTWRSAELLSVPVQGFYTIQTDPLEVLSSDVAIITIEEASPVGNPPVAGAEFGDANNLDFITVAGAMLENAHPTDATNLGTESMGIDGIACGDNGLTTNDYLDETGQAWLQLSGAGTPYANATFQNVVVANFPKWGANVLNVTALNSTLNGAILRSALSQQNMFGSSGSSSWALWIMNPMQIDAYARPLENRERYNIMANTPSPNPTGRLSLNQRGGQGEVLQFAGLGMYGSTMCMARRAYAITDDGVEKAVVKPWSFRDDGLSNDGRAAEVMKGMEIGNRFSRNRRKNLAIHGLALPSFTT